MQKNTLYYDYQDEDGQMNSTLEESIESIYKMLESYEEYSQTHITYTMNLEGRIRFTECNKLNWMNYL